MLIVGGIEVAAHCRTLERAPPSGCRAQVLPDEASAAAGKIEPALREFVPEDLAARLVIVATSRRAVNRWIATWSERARSPVNVVDDREASRFIVPAIIDRNPVLVAVATEGTSPVLARACANGWRR